MRVRELRQILETMDGNAHVVINDRIVASVVEIAGRAGDGIRHSEDTFRRVDGGRDKAVTFTCHREMSDGTWVLSTIFA